MTKQALIVISNNQLVTTSLSISNTFEKKHLHVLEAIRSLDCSTEFRLSNFRLSSYKNLQNKSQPLFEMTRDGFMFLCMGFTGAAAAGWKEHYIGEFNRMEVVLNAASQAPALSHPEFTQVLDVVAKLQTSVAQLVAAQKPVDTRVPHPNAIKALLKQYDNSVTGIAQELGVDPATVSRVLHGRGTSQRVATAIAEAAGVPADFIWPGQYA